MCLYGATWLGTALLRQQRGPGPAEPGPVAIAPITDTARHEPIQLLEFNCYPSIAWLVVALVGTLALLEPPSLSVAC
jgi:hypothetical protein